MDTASAAAPRTPWARAVGLGLALSLVVGGILLAFAWPSVTASAHGLPVGIVGDDAAVEQVQDAVDEHSDGAIDLVRYDDRDAAVSAVETRHAYGAIVLPSEPTAAPEVLKATAASAQVAAVMDGLARQLQAQVDESIRAKVETTVQQAQAGMADAVKAAVQAALSGQAPQAPPASASFEIPRVTVAVTDLVPFSEDDPQGIGLTVAMFPFVLGGMLGGIVISLLVTGAGRRIVGVVVYAAAAGLVLAGVLQGWLGALQGEYWTNAAALALAIAAISGTITGLTALFGRAGTAIGAASMILFANPLSAANLPVQFLLEPWGAIGQLMPPGAAATLLRDLSYFPDADASGPWLVLAVWAAAGLGLTALDLAGRRSARASGVAGTGAGSGAVAGVGAGASGPRAGVPALPLADAQAELSADAPAVPRADAPAAPTT